MPTQASTLALIPQIYDSAEQPETWPEILDIAKNAFRASSAAYTLEQLLGKESRITASSGVDPRLQPEYENYYYSVDPIMERMRPSLAPGRIFASHQICPDRVLSTSEYERDFLRRYDVYYVLTGVVGRNAERAGLIHFMRPSRMGPFEDEERSALEFLIPHFNRAARLANVFTAISHLRECLDSIPVGVLVLRKDASVVELNEMAARIIEQNDGISIIRGRLTLALQSEQRRFASLLTSEAGIPFREIENDTTTMLINRPSAKRSYFAMVTRLPEPRVNLLEASSLATFCIADPEMLPACSSDVLRQAFGLTPSEAELALGVVKGSQLTDLCQELKITRNTARAHLRSIFARVGVKRQAELVSVLIRTLALSPLARTGKAQRRGANLVRLDDAARAKTT